jgi:hypothetical protein
VVAAANAIERLTPGGQGFNGLWRSRTVEGMPVHELTTVQESPNNNREKKWVTEAINSIHVNF